MKQLFDYVPLLAFFAVWSMDERVVSIAGFERTVGGVFSAAEVLLLVSIIVYGGLFIAQRKLDKFQWITLGAVVLFCIPTIIFRNVAFLKWKAPIANWIFASIFIASRYFGDKPAIEHMMGHAVDAPREVWLRLNKLWVIFFLSLGLINLIVAFTLSESLWIKFKVFGNLGLTFMFVIAQMSILMKYIEPEDDSLEAEKSKKLPE